MKKRNTHHKPRQFSIGLDSFSTFCNNKVQTSKYTKLNFLPKAIILQFKRLANIYFLVTAVLQSIDVISSLSPVSAIAPFVLVITLSVIRELIEDLPKQKSDQKINSSKAQIHDEDGKFCETIWADVRVGDLLLVRDQQEFPADLLLLKSSNRNGLAFIETANLDGEKNLKPKYALQETAAYFKKRSLRGEGLNKSFIYAQPPDALIYKFEGAFINHHGGKTALSAKQLLLRGSQLKNCDWIIGVVVYTGNDTKLMRNAEKSKSKQSRVEFMMNRLIIVILFVQTIFCSITAIGNRSWGTDLEKHYYLPNKIGVNTEAVYSYLSYFLLTNTMIPISLIVTIEIVKFIQALFIQFDNDMYCEKKEKGAKVFCSSINEELGLVDYIFSDKTGTLTSNEMIFKNFVIGKHIYGDIEPGSPQRLLKSYREKGSSDENVEVKKYEEDEISFTKEKFSNHRLQHVLQSEHTEYINYDILNGEGEEAFEILTQKDLAIEFMQGVATCHECLAEKFKNGAISYQGQSQDEVRLVETASDVGIRFLGGNLEKFKLKILEHEQEFKILQIFEFNSDRKRMSILIRDGGTLKLYIKGADNVILERLNYEIEQPYLKFVDNQLEIFSKKGFRTLVYAMRMVSEDEYKKLKEDVDDIATADDREEKLAKIADDFERNLHLLGCSAVEDKLQDCVPEIIEDLLAADIKVWMLTGDKLETAENIAQSCKLLTGEMNIMRCFGKTDEEVTKKLKENQETFDLCLQEQRKRALIIEGEALTFVLADSEMKETFTNIVINCDAVICCRVTPKQKAEMVRIVKIKTQKVTLAIGDGANDVNMIQAANIGVGVYGHEGVQAVQASDYAIPQFKNMWRLLLVHGRWSYLRIAEMILYFFYKNMLFTLPQFFFAFINGFSGTTIYDDYYVTTYNLVFTALPLLVKALFEKDVDYKIRLPKAKITRSKLYVESPKIKAYIPPLYGYNKKGLIFTYPNFVYWVGKGVFMAVILFLFAIFGVDNHSIDSSGIQSSMWFTSITLYTCVIAVVSVKIVSYTRYLNIFFILALIVFSVMIYIIFNLVYDTMTMFKASNTVMMNYGSILFYATIIFFIGLEIMIDMGTSVIKKRNFPTPSDAIRKKILRELKEKNIYKLKSIEINSPQGNIELIQKPQKSLSKEESKDISYSLKNYKEEKEYKDTSVGLPVAEGSASFNCKTRTSDLKIKMEPSIGQDASDLTPVEEEEVQNSDDRSRPLSQSFQLNPGPSSADFKKKFTTLKSEEAPSSLMNDKSYTMVKNKRGSVPKLNIKKPPN